MNNAKIPLSTSNIVIIVEEVLKEENLMSIAELKSKLPKKIMHQTLIQILDYLQTRGKIIIGTKGVLWIYNANKNMKNAIAKGLEL